MSALKNETTNEFTRLSDGYTAALVHKRVVSATTPELSKRCKKSLSNSNSPRASTSPCSSVSSTHSSPNTANTFHNSPQSQLCQSGGTLLPLLFNSSQPSKIKSLECVDCTLNFTDQDNNVEYKLPQNKFAVTMAASLRNFVQSNIPPDTLLKFGITTDSESALASHKLLLYNASPYFRRKYDQVISQNGIFIIKMEPNLCINLVRICLEYIYSLGLGDIELGPRSSLTNLKFVAQFLELFDLARLVSLIIEREPEQPIYQPAAKNPAILEGAEREEWTKKYAAAAAHQKLSQMYTSFMIEQLLTKLCSEQNGLDNSLQATTIASSANSRFMSLFNRSKIDLTRFETDFELDTISRDLVIKDKYIYPSQNLTTNFLDSCFENSVLISLDPLKPPEKTISNEFHRHALIIFSINLEQRANSNESGHIQTMASSSSPEQSNSTCSSVELKAFKLQNFVIKSLLNFTELSLLKEDISHLFEQFLNQILGKCVSNAAAPVNYRCVVNRVCYLKKPSNCKTIRVETIKSSTDCLRAIVEYSRLNEATRELPFVFLTTHSSVYVTR